MSATKSRFSTSPSAISGIVEPGKGGRKLIPLDTMQQMIGTPKKVSLIYVKCDSPDNADLVLKEIHSTEGFEKNTLWTIDSWLNEMTPSKLPGFNLALEVVTSIAVIVGFLVIFQTMYTAVLERTREIGILKSMGASKMTIVTVLFARVLDAGCCWRSSSESFSLTSCAVRSSTSSPRSTLRFPRGGFCAELSLPLPARSSAQFIQPGWPPARTLSTRWRMSKTVNREQ